MDESKNSRAIASRTGALLKQSLLLGLVAALDGLAHLG
jgi:hypothetical protein